MKRPENRELLTDIWFLVSGFWFLVSGFWFQVSSFWFRVLLSRLGLGVGFL